MAQVILHKSLFYSNLGNTAGFRGAARLSSRAGREDKASKRTSLCHCFAVAFGYATRMLFLETTNCPSVGTKVVVDWVDTAIVIEVQVVGVDAIAWTWRTRPIVAAVANIVEVDVAFAESAGGRIPDYCIISKIS